MPRFAANLSLMFTEWSFLDRFAAAAEAGFAAVEFLFPYDFAPETIAQRLERHGLTQALFNMPPGDFAAGERGFAAVPGRFDAVRKSVETALVYAEATGVARLHMMAGLAARGDPRAGDAYRRSLTFAAERLAEKRIDLVIEPLNTRDNPGYFLDDFETAAALVRDLALPNLKLQFDVYHRQIAHGDVTMALRAMMPIIGHIQTASVPSRHEPCSEELDDRFVFAEIDRLGYDGFVGCEYRPRAGTIEGLRWFVPYAAERGGDAA